MKLINRKYLKELIEIIGTPDIKVITGVRSSANPNYWSYFMNI